MTYHLLICSSEKKKKGQSFFFNPFSCFYSQIYLESALLGSFLSLCEVWKSQSDGVTCLSDILQRLSVAFRTHSKLQVLQISRLTLFCFSLCFRLLASFLFLGITKLVLTLGHFTLFSVFLFLFVF